MILAAEVGERPEVLRQPGDRVEVAEPLVDAVLEGMADRSRAPVRDPASNERRQRGQLRQFGCLSGRLRDDRQGSGAHQVTRSAGRP